MSLPERLAEALQELKGAPEDLRADLLIDWSLSYSPPPAEIALPPYDEAHRVPGCESEVFVFVTILPGDPKRFELFFAVENPQGISAKALAAFLQTTLKDETGDAIGKVPDEVVYDLFGRTLSMGKGQGLMGMVRMVKLLVRKSS